MIALVLTTAGSEAEAQRIAGELVGAGLAACVSVLPGVRSTYRWEGQVRTDTEWLLIVKTRGERFEEVRAAIRKLHSYEVPEIVMVPAADVDEAYARWLLESVPER